MEKIKKMFKKDSVIEEQIEIADAKIRAADYGSDEWQKYVYLRDKLIKQKQDEKVNIPWKDIADVGLRVAEIGLNVGIVVYGYKLYANIAALSYGMEDNLKLCNGRVNNMKDLVMKLVPKKV